MNVGKTYAVWLRGLAFFAAFALAGFAEAGDATWNFRAGVGASPASPTLWTDPENWVGGEPASGLTATATFPNAGTSANVIWVKLPDDVVVSLGGMLHQGTSPAKYRFIGGKGFRFGGNFDSGRQAQLKFDSVNGDWDIIFSPVTVSNWIDLRGISLACPMTFEQSATKQMHFYYPTARYHCELFAPCGGETRSPIPGLTRLCIAHSDEFIAPLNNDAHTGAWVATAGSKMLKWVSGKKGTALAVGQYLHASGIVPANAYVERIYTDGYVEMSAPAIASSADASAGTSIQFDRCYYKLTQHVDTFYFYGNQGGCGFGDRRVAENVMTLDIGGFSGELDLNAGVFFQYPDQAYWSFNELAMEQYPNPPVTQLPDLSGCLSYFGARGAYFRFTSTEPRGADIQRLKFYDSASYKRNGFAVFDTPQGVTSTVTTVNEWFGSVGKKGAGDLKMKTSIAGHYYLRVYEGRFTLDPSAAGSALAKVTIKGGGAFELATGRALTVTNMIVGAGATFRWPTDATLAIRTLSVEAGGTLDIPSGAALDIGTLTPASGGGTVIRVGEGVTFDATGRTIPDGTVFEGPGAVTGLTNAKIRACVLRGGVTVTATGSAANLAFTDTLSAELPTRISPAFWVSTKADGTVIKGDTTHTGVVTQWNDVRGTPAQGYHFATNTVAGGFKINDTTYAPRLNSSNSGTAGSSLVMMQKTATAVTSPGNSPALVWDKPIKGIKAVFAVVAGQYDGQNGGGSLLGSTERLSTCHFYRQNVGTCFNDRFHSDNSLTWNAPYYVNGHNHDGETMNGAVRAKPMLVGNFVQVVDVHPLGDGAEADCWGYQRTNPNAYGAWIGECLIYTNAVTEIERRHIENYLMQKWFGSRVIGAEIVPADQDMTTAALGDATLNVGAGDAVSFAVYTNATGLVKTGAGEIHLKGLQTAGALKVGGGTVTVESYDATQTNALPAGALLHVDANDDDSFPGATTVSGGQGAVKWIDTDNPSNPLALCQVSAAYSTLPVRTSDTTSFAQPMKVVDYGAFHNNYDTDWKVKDASGWYGTPAKTVAHVLRYGSTTAITNATGIKGVFAVWGTAAGGNQLLGGWNQAASGLTRDYTNSAQVAVNGSKTILNGVATDGYRTGYNPAVSWESLSLVNGADRDLGFTAPSGAYDVVSLLTPYSVGCSSLGAYAIRNKVGGLQMGELILYTKMLTSDEAKRVDAYLNYKWFGRTPDITCRPATVGALAVAEGATVNVEGNGAIRASSVSGAGTVNGKVELLTDAVLGVPVDADGMITETLTVSGAVDFSKGGAIRLTGNQAKLRRGKYRILSVPKLTAPAAWRVVDYTGRWKLRVNVADDGLWLQALGGGLVVYVIR